MQWTIKILGRRRHWGSNSICVCLLLLLLLLLLLIMATSLWGLSELWGGGIPTSYIDQSRPRLCRLLIYSLLIVPVPPSPLAVWYLASPVVVFLPASARYHTPTWASPIFAPAYRKKTALLSLTRHYQRPTPPLLPHPYHACQIPVAAAPMPLPKYLLTLPSDVVMQPPVATTAHATFLVSCIICKDIKYWS